MSAPDPRNAETWTCPLCGSQLGDHHLPSCKHWGPVLPSEVPGLIESVMAEVLLKRLKKDGKP